MSASSGRDLNGIRVLVTGGTSGLGRSMAVALGRAGARVVLTGRDGARAASVADQLDGEVSGLALRGARPSVGR